MNSALIPEAPISTVCLGLMSMPDGYKVETNKSSNVSTFSQDDDDIKSSVMCDVPCVCAPAAGKLKNVENILLQIIVIYSSNTIS